MTEDTYEAVGGPCDGMYLKLYAGESGVSVCCTDERITAATTSRDVAADVALPTVVLSNMTQKELAAYPILGVYRLVAHEGGVQLRWFPTEDGASR